MRHLTLALTLVASLSSPSRTHAADASADEIFTVDPVEYGSTYSSNCSCLFCTKYCQVDGSVVKSGTCC